MAEPQALQRGFGKLPIQWFRKQPIKLTDGFGNLCRRWARQITGQRNIAAALLVASQGFSDPKVVVMVIVVAIVGLIILMPLSRALASPIGPMRHGS